MELLRQNKNSGKMVVKWRILFGGIAMSNYKEMYFKLLCASEKALNILIDAQLACEELYVEQDEPELLILKNMKEGKH